MTTVSLSTTKRWRPTPLLWASLAIHALAALAVALHLPMWPWALAAVAVNHLVLTICGLIPRNDWLGENIRRLPADAAAQGQWALTIDDGPDPEITPAVLDLLDHHGVKATFFCIAANARAHPALTAEIVRRGHSVQNHSDVHAHSFSLWGGRRIEAELQRAQAEITALTGQTPRFFRAPAGLRNPLLAPVLARMGLTLVSWTRRAYDTRVKDPDRVLQRLLPALEGGSILLLHDGHAARTADGDRPVVLEVLPRLLAEAQARGLRAVTLTQALR